MELNNIQVGKWINRIVAPLVTNDNMTLWPNPDEPLMRQIENLMKREN